MQITVKILGGQECSLEVTSSMLITDLKKELSVRMNIPVESQKLVFKGKTMLDASKVGEHTLEEGAKVHLVVSKAPVAGSSSASSNNASSTTHEPEFWAILNELLSKHFAPEDVEKIIKEYRADLEGGLQSLNLDDIERMAHGIVEGQPQAASNQAV
ncbi:ubiquitin-like protein 4A [Galendromus occidentalis]|uniref:Ubiquitin-like protein 4A n=1 Tax=Galendromus occidentalis TaxID=34638 RepID=A0AAJ6QPY5_9ACAR|nr:ubiquitin-like protein 4A [Galendromus occidentalis]